MEHRAKVSQGKQELAVVEREIRKLVHAIKDGVSATSIKKELLALEARQAELQQKLEAPEMPELLHPRMADVYRERVSGLCEALEREDSRSGATTAIRGLIEAILLEPDGDQLKITLKGDLAGMLSAARDSKRSPDTGDLLVQIQMVAGARSRLYRPRCTSWLYDLPSSAPPSVNTWRLPRSHHRLAADRWQPRCSGFSAAHHLQVVGSKRPESPTR